MAVNRNGGPRFSATFRDHLRCDSISVLGLDWLQDAIKRRFNKVLARITILSIHFRLGAALGLNLLSFRPPGLN